MSRDRRAPGLSRLALWLLLAGAGLNLAAGLRRPLVERAILARGHYPAMDAAADTVRRRVPADASFALIGYEADMLEELDLSIWADYRTKWLLYPRRPEVYQDRAGRLYRREAYVMTGGGYSAAPVRPSEAYALVFRGSGLPVAPDGYEIVEQGPMFLLARRIRQ